MKEHYPHYRSHRRPRHPHNPHTPSSPSSTTTTTGTNTASTSRLHYRLPDHVRHARRRTSFSSRLTRYRPTHDNRSQHSPQQVSGHQSSDRGRYVPGINTHSSDRGNLSPAHWYTTNRTDSHRLRQNSLQDYSRNSLNSYQRRNHRMDYRNRYRNRSQYRSQQGYNSYRHSNTYNSLRHSSGSSHLPHQREWQSNPTGIRQDSHRRSRAYQQSGQEATSNLIQSRPDLTRSRSNNQNTGMNSTVPVANRNTGTTEHSAVTSYQVSRRTRPKPREDNTSTHSKEYSSEQASRRIRSRYYGRDSSRGYRNQENLRLPNYSNEHVVASNSRSPSSSNPRQNPNSWERSPDSTGRPRRLTRSRQDERTRAGDDTSRRSDQQPRSLESMRLEGLARRATDLDLREAKTSTPSQKSQSPALTRRTVPDQYNYQARSGRSRVATGQSRSRRFWFFSGTPESTAVPLDLSPIDSEQRTLGVMLGASNISPDQLTREEKRKLMHSNAVRRRHERRRRGKG
ncbi:hypothetical protein EGW08_014604 [Elysia chlorotica]|uniref:Uncharacterized protein n=1 Tax=Elysia chlorotica TaxID=188477 RepID=A0A3S0ZHB2_ELYCH|nr:hypothetical protein EGW08_014604 [Elysia chlorotica]